MFVMRGSARKGSSHRRESMTHFQAHSLKLLVPYCFCGKFRTLWDYADRHPKVSRWDRMLAFTICNLGAAACFVICFFLFPVLSLRPRKFAVL